MTTRTATRTDRPDYTKGMATRTLGGGAVQVFETCWKCNGTGEYPSSAWDGVCLACQRYGNYSGGRWISRDEYNRLAHNRELARARRARKAAEKAAAKPARDAALHAELTEAHPLLAELTYLGNVDHGNGYGHDYAGILGDLRAKLEQYGSLSDRQIAFAEKLVREGMERQVRDAERAAARQAEAAARTNAAIGEIGDRRDFTGKIRFVREIDGQWGVSTLIVFDTAEGAVKWFATGRLGVEHGDTITVKATVKDHDVYERTGEITTIVTRGKIAA